jgi:excinuclease ABC subunit C
MELDLKQIPKTPGIYKFFSNNKIIYIGKAKNLKTRVSSYFSQSIKDRKTQQIKKLTDKIETFSTQTEAGALLLEQSLIKENLPRFNILLRDDKTYPYIHFSMSHKFPSVSMKRSKHSVSKDFFGPFISASAVKSSIKDLQKIFKVRNCSNSTFSNRSRPCIEHQMQRCSAPCVGIINENNYMEDISSAQYYLSYSGKKAKNLMLSQMQKFSDQQDFEKANEVKKRISSLDLLQQEQSINSNLTSVDFFSCIFKHGRTGACILSIRDGKIRGTKTYYFKDDHNSEVDQLLHSLIFSYYQNAFSLPDKILLTFKSNNLDLIYQAIKMKFNKSVRISAKVPIGAKQLSKLSILNAKQIIENKTKASDRYLHSISDLQKKLGTKNRNLSIEGYDISHLSGTNAVASCVRFNEEGPDKRLYRIFNIPLELSGNDTGSLAYALKRRILKKDINSLPNIILIDGGQLQLNAVLDVFNAMDIQPPIVLSIVKGSKRIRASETILSQNGIIEISKDSAGFRLLQQVRDESHRFALKNSRNKKNKKTKFSTLNLIEGLGPVMQKRLINKFKSLKNIKNASSSDLLLIPGISKKLCERIKEGLN